MFQLNQRSLAYFSNYKLNTFKSWEFLRKSLSLCTESFRVVYARRQPLLYLIIMQMTCSRCCLLFYALFYCDCRLL